MFGYDIATNTWHPRASLSVPQHGALMREANAKPPREAIGDRRSPARPVRSRAGRFLVHLHVDAEALRTGSEVDQSVMADRRISAETSRRLSCDAGRVLVTCDSATGTEREPGAERVLGAERKPGQVLAGSAAGTGDAREVGRRHGGPTTLENTVLLCRRHHRAVHEEGFRITVNKGALTFHRPDGRPLPEVPPAPALCGDPVALLRAATPSIDGWTAAPQAGVDQRLDLDLTLVALREG